MPKALVPQSPRSVGNPHAAGHTRSTRRSPTAAQTRTAAPAGDRNPAPADRNPSRSPGHSCGHAPPLRSLAVPRLPPNWPFRTQRARAEISWSFSCGAGVPPACVRAVILRQARRLHHKSPPANLHRLFLRGPKGLERLDPIEDSLQLHPVVAPGEMSCLSNPSLPGNLAGCTCSPTSSFRYTVSVWRNGVGLCGDATRQGIARPTVRQWCIRIRPLTAKAVGGCFLLPPIGHQSYASKNPGVWGRAPGITSFSTHKFC